MHPPPADVSNTRRWHALIILVLSQFLLVLDDTVVNIALPSIQADLGFSAPSLVWVVNGYVLAYGGLLLLGGRAADLFGRRRVFLGGLAVFGTASLASGLAQSEAMLIAARIGQGVGAAAASPAALALVVTLFTDPAERGKALGLFGATAGLAGSVGVVLSGVITDMTSWRWIFFINIPIVAVVLVLLPTVVSKTRRAPTGSFDILGAVTLTGGMMALVYGLLGTADSGWTSTRTLVALGAAGVLLAAFITAERHVPTPLIRLGFFRHRTRTTGYLALGLTSATVFTLLFLLTLYLQQVLDYSPLRAGLTYLVLTLATVVGVGAGSRLSTRFGIRPVLVAGTLTGAVGLAYLSQLPGTGGILVHLAPGMLLFGAGVGASLVAVQIAGTLDADDRDEAGLASGLLSGSLQIGGALGLAALVTAGTEVTGNARAAGMSPEAAQLAGTEFALLLSAALLLLVSALAAFLLERPRSPSPPQPETWSDRLDALSNYLDTQKTH